MHQIFPKVLLSTCFLQNKLESMDLGASQQCSISGCNVLFNNYFEFLHVFSVFINKNTSKRGCFGLKSTMIEKKYLELLFGKSGTYKPKNTLKPILSQNMVDFT